MAEFFLSERWFTGAWGEKLPFQTLEKIRMSMKEDVVGEILGKNIQSQAESLWLQMLLGITTPCFSKDTHHFTPS